MFWEYNSVELPQRESVGIQLRKVSPKECWVRMQFRRIASKRMLLDATSAKCFRKNVLMTLTQGHNFDLGFLTQGQIWFLTWGRFFIYFFEFGWWFKVKSWFSTQVWILILLMMTQGQDSFTFGFQWMTLGQEFHLFFFVRFEVMI